MKKEIATEYRLSIARANAAEQRGDLDGAFAALERAHILAQRYLISHVYTHWRMLKVGVQRQDVREMFGQLVRLLATVPAYLLGWVPKGNTGGSNVSALKPMSLPADIAPLLDDFSVWRDVAKRAALVLVLLMSGLAALYLLEIRHTGRANELEQSWAPAVGQEPIVLSTTSSLVVTPVVNFHALDGFQSEPGVAYLVQTDQHLLLFDLGFNHEGVDQSPLEHNLKRLGVTHKDLDAIFISHTHRDHIGGLRWEAQNSFGFGNAQPPLGDTKVYATAALRYPGSKPQHIEQPQAIMPAIGSTGPIPRQLILGRIDEQALIINLQDRGLVLIVGCGHQTMEKLIAQVEANFEVPVYGLIGDVHYPVPRGRLRIAGIDVQRRLASGQGLFSPITRQQVERDLEFLSDKLGFVALGSHDTSNAALDSAAAAMPGRFSRVVAGQPIVIAR